MSYTLLYASNLPGLSDSDAANLQIQCHDPDKEVQGLNTEIQYWIIPTARTLFLGLERRSTPGRRFDLNGDGLVAGFHERGKAQRIPEAGKQSLGHGRLAAQAPVPVSRPNPPEHLCSITIALLFQPRILHPFMWDMAISPPRSESQRCQWNGSAALVA